MTIKSRTSRSTYCRTQLHFNFCEFSLLFLVHHPCSRALPSAFFPYPPLHRPVLTPSSPHPTRPHSSSTALIPSFFDSLRRTPPLIYHLPSALPSPHPIPSSLPTLTRPLNPPSTGLPSQYHIPFLAVPPPTRFHRSLSLPLPQHPHPHPTPSRRPHMS